MKKYSFRIMPSVNEVPIVVFLYICLCLVLYLISILTQSKQFAVDFTLVVNDTANVSVLI